jgi:hypothetical protein
MAGPDTPKDLALGNVHSVFGAHCSLCSLISWRLFELSVKRRVRNKFSNDSPHSGMSYGFLFDSLLFWTSRFALPIRTGDLTSGRDGFPSIRMPTGTKVIGKFGSFFFSAA